ncbi:MAG TPA: DUF167 family protein [Pelagibacterium sp.]|uniref:DUF167 domain-containing protein n=1 Tax=Pelagibacterium sp. TaxID=1967288 RepID=UPI002BE5FF37|nr:DUF167 family protein [Pelagibacterium sp.]HWJ87595.1 DUF167 family protein [Pelagibacterium sp.]
MNQDRFYTLIPDGARLSLRVTPNARTSAIEGPELRADGSCALKLRVTAPPDKGAANSAVIALLAKALGRPKSAFTLHSGQTARSKIIVVAGDSAQLAAALDAL